MKKKNLKAFTLAEILITLSIIGVVAALTIPTLIQRTGDEEMVSKLMKAYSTLAQATDAIITEQGSPKVWNTDADSLYNAYKSHLRNAKECGTASGCLKQFNNNNRYLYLNGKGKTSNWDASGKRNNLILADGVQISFEYGSSSCSWISSGSNDVCSFINADLNGEKAPNIIGRDVFLFALKETGLYPAGCDEDGWCDKTASGDLGGGFGCACRVLQEGKINY